MNLKFNTKLLELEKKSSDSLPFPSTFAINRFWKKFEKPGEVDQDALHAQAWETFLDTDLSLPKIQRVDGLWYKVREVLHSLPYYLDWDSIDFPKGSEFIATNGKNSIEARLVRSTWTVTKDCFDDFARVVYSHAALKRAYRYRFRTYCSKHSMSDRRISRYLWEKYKNAYTCFRMKLSLIVQFERGSRFSTVPKKQQCTASD